MINDTWQQFESLNQTKNVGGVYSVITFDEKNECFFYKDSNDYPVFIRRLENYDDFSDFRLKYISVTFGIEYRVEILDKFFHGRFIKIACENGSLELQKVFITAIKAILTSLDTQTPHSFIRRLIELFSSRQPTKREVIGLWGELAFINSRPSRGDAIKAWHSNPLVARDFTFEKNAIEIKTTTSSSRKHVFSLSQISDCQDTDQLCSIKLEQTELGVSTIDLANTIVFELESDVTEMFWKKFFDVADITEPNLTDLKFNYDRAVASFQMIRLKDICVPTIQKEGIGRIISVKFEILFD
jgi:hypothetical protein